MITAELRQRAHDMLNGCVEDDLLDVAKRIDAEYDALAEHSENQRRELGRLEAEMNEVHTICGEGGKENWSIRQLYGELKRSKASDRQAREALAFAKDGIRELARSAGIDPSGHRVPEILAMLAAWRESVIELPKDALGKPIRMGDTVRCGDGEPFGVAEIRFREGREALVGDGSGCWYFRASSCSHAAPDSWEAIEAEARERLDDGLHPNDGWVLDLLYRVRDLYEGEEG
ncbi:hypothetical protein EII22_08865 [Coriobacteriales bacterium OH1046]|nr:hypothetical protein EII22_08865 [Coriobacteriales bacterium OH1046]